MDLPTALVGSVRDLLVGLTLGEGDVVDPLRSLLRDAAAAVTSFLGLELVLVADGYPIRLTAFAPDVRTEQIAASLRLDLRSLGLSDPSSSITFFAATAGSMVDLAADLTYALGPRSARDGDRAGDAFTPVRVDQNLTPVTMTSGLSGLAEWSAVQQGIGVLVGLGHPPDSAAAELRRRATGAGLTPHRYAAQLLGEQAARREPEW